MKKNHILLIENDETEAEFFTDALEESGLSFLCSTASNIEQAFRLLRNSMPDIIFIDIHITGMNDFISFKKINTSQKIPLVMYSTVANKKKLQVDPENLNYVQLPGSTSTMARILKNLFIDNEIRNQPAKLV